MVDDKALRVQRYHEDTIHAFLELIASSGLASPADITPGDVLRRVGPGQIESLAEIYPTLPESCLLDDATVPPDWRERWRLASARRFASARG